MATLTSDDGTAWDITLDPSGEAAVTLTLAVASDCDAAGAICTEDDRALSRAVSVTIAGPPPEISIADATVQEGPNAKLRFHITLSHASSETITVQASTADGTATAGSDYRAKTLTKTFAPGETSKIAVIRVLNDSNTEGSETMTLTLSNVSGAEVADGVATGTITDGS